MEGYVLLQDPGFLEAEPGGFELCGAAEEGSGHHWPRTRCREAEATSRDWTSATGGGEKAGNQESVMSWKPREESVSGRR